MNQQFDPYRRNFASLSTSDLLAARATFHVHFSHLTRVAGTAIGLYLIRDQGTDAWRPTSVDQPVHQRGTRSARPLDNSRVTQWSWPCKHLGNLDPAKYALG